MENLPAAAADLRGAVALLSPHEHGYQFYSKEMDRLAKAAKEAK